MSRKTVYQKAKEWRERRAMTKPQLAELTGYSVEAISWFEKGIRPPGAKQRGSDRTHNPYAWHRYRMACAGVELMLREDGRLWDWQ